MDFPLRFALLVPCKNGARFIRQLTDSALAQHRPFDERILCDDGSTDDTAAVAAKNGWTVIHNPTSIGPAATRNRLAEVSSCDWLHFHDADDLMDSRYLERTADIAARDDADLVICAMQWIHEKSGTVDMVWSYDESELRRNPLAALIGNTVGGINGLYRRAFFTQLGGFDPRRDYWEDLEFSVRWLRGGARIRVVPDVLVTAIRRADSYSNTRLTRVWRSKAELLERWLPSASADERSAIAVEAEHLAARLLQVGDMPGGRAALRLNHRAGGNAPETNHPLLRALKTVLPPWWVYRLQQSWRS